MSLSPLVGSLGVLGVSRGVAGSTLLDGLVAFWEFDETTGHRANSIAGAAVATPSAAPTQAQGASGYAAQVVASKAQHFTVPYMSTIPTGANSFTVAMRLYFDTLGTQPGIIDKNVQTEWYALYLSSNQKIRFRLVASALASVDSTTTITATGVWRDVRMWYDTATARIYVQIDGGAINNATVTGSPATTATALRIGRGGSVSFDGRMQHVGIWNRVLTDAEWVLYRTLGSYPFTAADTLQLTKPTAYQVYQRSGSNGNIAIQGTYTGAPTAIEARWSGGSWATIDAAPANGRFTGTLSAQAQGQGTLEVRFTNNTGVGVSVANVGIGEVFIIAGQSNASGRGTSNQVYSHATLKAVLYGNNYAWRELADPTDINTAFIDSVSSDAAAAGSMWPLLATSLMADQGVPVAFVPCAMGGTGIVVWQPGADHQNVATLYGSMVYRALQMGGCRAVLWWQGETDAVASMSQATYNSNLDTIANAVNADLGCKLMPCKLQTFSAATGPQQAAINAAIVQAWGDNTNVLTGPDLTGLTANDTFHLMSNGNLSSASALWWTALETAFGW